MTDEIPRGSRVRLTARFKTRGRAWDPNRVTARVIDRSGTRTFEPYGGLEHVELGGYAVEVIARDVGPLLVVFEADTGEFSETRYDVVDAASQVSDAAFEPDIDRDGYMSRERADLGIVEAPETPAPDPEPPPAPPAVSRWVGSVLSGNRKREPWRKT